MMENQGEVAHPARLPSLSARCPSPGLEGPGMKPSTIGKGFFFLILLVLLAPAFAGPDMVGRWRASSGYTVIIPAGTGSFNLVFERSGERIVHPAVWVKPGIEFTWTDKVGNSHKATYQPGDPERIEDVNAASPESKAYYYRIP